MAGWDAGEGRRVKGRSPFALLALAYICLILRGGSLFGSTQQMMRMMMVI